jgi:MFS family permease
MVLVDQTAVPLTLPAIMRHYDISSQSAQWVLNGSLVALAPLLVFGGQPGDLPGRRRVFIAGTIVFAAASARAAPAPTWLLILCRVIQGASGAAILPATVALVADESTGLKPRLFDPLLSTYLDAAGTATAWGYAAAFLGVMLLGIAGVILAVTSSRSKNKVVSDLG